MEASDHDDRKRQRVKPNKRRMWAKALLRPQTWKLVVSVGMTVAKVIGVVTRVIWAAYEIIHFMRE